MAEKSKPEDGEGGMEYETFVCTLLLALMFLATAGMATAGETLDTVKARRVLIVGATGAVVGFSMPDKKGVWKGLDVDTARAIAVAVFGDASKVKFVALTTIQRLPAL